MQDLQAGGSTWQRKEVPLCVMQDSSNPSTLSDYGEAGTRPQPKLCLIRLWQTVALVWRGTTPRLLGCVAAV